MIKKLIYLFISAIVLAGCHRDSHYHLERAKDLWTVHFDSVQYHLGQIAPSELSGETRFDYHYMQMHTLRYQKELGKEQADSISRMLVEHYPEGHERAFKARMLRSFCCIHVLNDYQEADSLITTMHPLIRSRNDSINWYGYKIGHKRRLGEADSAIHYLKEALHHHVYEESYAYGQMGEIYQQQEKNDSAIHYYFLAFQTDTTQSTYRYCHKVLDLLYSLKEYDKAKQYIQSLRKQMKRPDIPYINLTEGDLWMELHQPDSAMKHYLIASETGNNYISSVAYERLALLMEESRILNPALDKHIQSIKLKSSIHLANKRDQDFYEVEALKMKNELNELKVKQQSYVIMILALGASILLLVGGFAIHLLHRKRKRLQEENLLLKQQEELSVLREKEALLREKDAKMREELFRRIRIIVDLKEGKHEHQISDADWKDIHVMLESTYPGFLPNLRQSFPALSEKELNFCCLVKINMSLQQLADIYCISINSVSRRKLRLKEKLGIDKEDSLSKFLNRFV